MDQETDDDVMMDTSPESHRDSDGVNPSVTHQYRDDMDNPQVTNQEPEDVSENPLTHNTKYTETPNKDNDDPAVTDSTTSVPFTSPDQDPGGKTSYKAHEEYKVKMITLLKYVPKRFKKKVFTQQCYRRTNSSSLKNF